MSDNPGGENELFTLDFVANDQVTAYIAQLNEELHRMETAALGAADQLGNQAFVNFTNQIDDIAKAVRTGEGSITSYQRQLVDLSEEYDVLHPVLQEIISDYHLLNAQMEKAQALSAYNKGEFINEATAGYGVKGGMIGPGEDQTSDWARRYGVTGGLIGPEDNGYREPEDWAKRYGVKGGLIGPAEADAEGVGGGKVSSLNALARAGRGIGTLAGDSGAGQGVASLLYITQAAEGLGALNASLITTGGLVPQLTTALVAAEIPMAGLVALVLPIAAAVAVVAGTIALYNAELKESTALLNEALARTHAYYEAITVGTTQELEQKLASAKDTQAASLAEYAALKAQHDKQLDETTVRLGTGARIALENSEGFKALTKSMDDAKKAADAATGRIEGMSDAIRNSSVIKANDAVEATMSGLDAEAKQKAQFAADNKLSTDAITDNIKALKDEIEAKKAANATLLAAVVAAAQAGASAGEILKLNQAIDANAAAINADQARLDNFNNVAYGLADAAETAAAAVKLQTEITKDHIAFVEQENKLRASGTPTQFGTARVGIQSKIAGAESEYDALTAAGGQRNLTTDEKDRMQDLLAIIKEYNNQLADLDSNIKPVVDAREAMKNLTDASADFAAKQKSLQDALQLQQDSARAKELQAEEQYTIGSLQDVQQRTKIKLDESRKETELTQATSDKIVDIMNGLTNKENQLTENFSRHQQDDITKYNQDAAKLVRNAQNQQREDDIEHLAKLREIRQADRIGDQRAILDRNFLKLFEDAQARTTAEQKENDSYAARENKLSRTLANQESELAISLANEQKQQRLAYTRKFEDLQQQAQQDEIQANLNESRKRAQLQQSEQEQLQDLSTSENNKIAILRNNLQNELTLMGAAEQAKLTLFQQTTDAIIAYNTAALAAAFAANPSAVGSTGAGIIGGGGGTSYMYAQGGNFNAGQSFIMGEDGPEALNFGNKSYGVGGAALVMPLQSGSVTQAGGSGDRIFAPTINLFGTTSDPITPEMIQHAVYDAWEDISGDNA